LVVGWDIILPTRRVLGRRHGYNVIDAVKLVEHIRSEPDSADPMPSAVGEVLSYVKEPSREKAGAIGLRAVRRGRRQPQGD
jgi:hypothetical protein